MRDSNKTSQARGPYRRFEVNTPPARHASRLSTVLYESTLTVLEGEEDRIRATVTLLANDFRHRFRDSGGEIAGAFEIYCERYYNLVGQRLLRAIDQQRQDEELDARVQDLLRNPHPLQNGQNGATITNTSSQATAQLIPPSLRFPRPPAAVAMGYPAYLPVHVAPGHMPAVISGQPVAIPVVRFPQPSHS